MVEESQDKRKIRTNRVNLWMTIYGKRERIFFTKDVIRILGVPNFICIRVNAEWNSVLVMPCADKDYLSFRVPNDILSEPNKKMEFRSKAFTDTLLKSNGLDRQGTYTVQGWYFEKRNVLVFDFRNVKTSSKHSEYG